MTDRLIRALESSCRSQHEPKHLWRIRGNNRCSHGEANFRRNLRFTFGALKKLAEFYTEPEELYFMQEKMGAWASFILVASRFN